MTRSEELGEDANEQFELARAPPNVMIDRTIWADPIFDTIEQERMLADLSELHKLVAETLDTAT